MEEKDEEEDETKRKGRNGIISCIKKKTNIKKVHMKNIKHSFAEEEKEEDNE